MSRVDETSNDGTIQAILAALLACYGSLTQPNFEKVEETLKTPPYQRVVESLRSS